MTFDATQYWDARYRMGYTSGDGSYGDLADFKAEVINAFVDYHDIQSVIEWGCGDGNQLSLAQYPAYLGLDVSLAAVLLCRNRFALDRTKEFAIASDWMGIKAELALSLDVIFHLTDESDYNSYMCNLFDSAERYVIVYSSDTNEQQAGQSPHMRHHCHTTWVRRHATLWKKLGEMPNRYPDRSVSSFVFYGRKNAAGGI